MPRPTVKIQLTCFKCKKSFSILRWEYNQKKRRKTLKTFCSKKCKVKFQRLGGKFSPSWKGGRRVFPSTGGYVMLNIGPMKRMFEHRYIMEKHLGRKLKKKEVIHHINGIPHDNRIENLVLCKSAGYHSKKYHHRDGSLK